MTDPPLPILGQVQVTNLPEWALPAAGGVLLIGLLILSRSLFNRRPARVVEKAKVTYQRENVAAHGHGEERRRWPRRGGSPTPVVIQDPRGRSPAWEGTVIDRSVGGLCLLVDREVAKGTRLKVRPKQAPEHVRAVEVTAVYASSAGEKWQIGCQFVGQPPMNVLLFFG